MALIGGGGAGNVAGGSNPVGTGKGLNYIGDFAYAYSGLHAANTTEFTVLSFSTGSSLFVGEFQLNGALNQTSPGEIEQTNAVIKFNGTAIMLITSGNSAIDAPMSQTQGLLIPAYTLVEVVFDMAGTNTDRYASATIVGRVYE